MEDLFNEFVLSILIEQLKEVKLVSKGSNILKHNLLDVFYENEILKINGKEIKMG